MSGLVTGEAVVVDLAIARPATRALSLCIDLLVEFIAYFALITLIALIAGDDASDSLIVGLSIACGVVTFVGYATAMETLTRGKTLGKFALGLRVVRDDGGPIRFRHALVRALSGVFVDFFTTLGCAGFLTAMLNSKGKRVGDILAGTVVLRERGPAAPNPLPPVPPELAGWAAHAELSRIPDDLAHSARTFLSRYYELSAPAREALGNRLASAVAEYVSPAPPAGVPAWAYLAAVLGERRNRTLRQEQGRPAQPPPPQWQSPVSTQPPMPANSPTNPPPPQSHGPTFTPPS
ncbi:MAG TPA: RDD family protein [Actinopolymorphaceae bacterium]